MTVYMINDMIGVGKYQKSCVCVEKNESKTGAEETEGKSGKNL